MAPEIGHLLLGATSHADEGLMRGEWRSHGIAVYTRSRRARSRGSDAASPDSERTPETRSPGQAAKNPAAANQIAAAIFPARTEAAVVDTTGSTRAPTRAIGYLRVRRMPGCRRRSSKQNLNQLSVAVRRDRA
jgi:hypothetical protein